MFFSTVIILVCFGFLPDDEIKLLSIEVLVNGSAVEGFALLLLCIFVSLVFSPDIFANLFPLNIFFLINLNFEPEVLLSDASCFGFIILDKYCNSEIYVIER